MAIRYPFTFNDIHAHSSGIEENIHNIVIELKSPTHATGYAYLELRSSAQQMKWMGTGYYEDEYEKVGGQWKLKARRFKMVHSEM